jgi:uncharacterized protein YodC (DUF2158 family)
MADVMMSQDHFKNGDRVKLKSGGPMMTVSDLVEGKIECSWFFDGNIRREHFNPHVLKLFIPKKREASTAE